MQREPLTYLKELRQLEGDFVCPMTDNLCEYSHCTPGRCSLGQDKRMAEAAEAFGWCCVGILACTIVAVTAKLTMWAIGAALGSA